MQKIPMLLCALAAFILSGCERVTSLEFDNEISPLPQVSNEDLAKVLSILPLSAENFKEVSDAVNSSSRNGYDEEYPLEVLFSSPGYGVGDKYITPSKAQAAREYSTPLKDLLSDYYNSLRPTKAEGGQGADGKAYLEALRSSDMQIYWPYSGSWDGVTPPVITFDPLVEASANKGYELGTGAEVTVDEQMARTRPVWVVNNNSDKGHVSMEIFTQMRARGEPVPGVSAADAFASKTIAGGSFKTLILRNMTALRHHDLWLAGGSEYFVKIGAINHFSASTETELKLYNPFVTDFMKVIRRRDMGTPQECNIVLVSEWSPQLESCAFLITEDDGGSQQSWKTEVTVKVNSKSYGLTVNLPLNIHDDIIWRGSLGCSFLEAYAGETVHFGDMDIVFDFLEY